MLDPVAGYVTRPMLRVPRYSGVIRRVDYQLERGRRVEDWKYLGPNLTRYLGDGRISCSVLGPWSNSNTIAISEHKAIDAVSKLGW